MRRLEHNTTAAFCDVARQVNRCQSTALAVRGPDMQRQTTLNPQRYNGMRPPKRPNLQRTISIVILL